MFSRQDQTRDPAKVTQAVQNSTQRSPNAFIYLATVGEIYPQSYLVQIDVGSGGGTTYGIMITAWMSGLLGLQATCMPQKGSQVIVLKNTLQDNGLDLILGVVPAGGGFDYTLLSSYVGADNTVAYPGVKEEQRALSQENLAFFNQGSYPMDGVDGELFVNNALGAGLEILQNLTRLKGSDLAKVEAFVMDDFVRIVSHNFAHITAFGDYTINNANGRLNVVWKGTSNEHEAFGLQDKSESKGYTMAAKNLVDVNTEEDTEKTFYEDGRWRFVTYIGKLGGFVHMFITDPQKVLQTNIPDNVTSARHNLHINQDGSMLMQTVGEIAIEKVVRIPVPISRATPEELANAEVKLDAYQNWTPMPGEEMFHQSYKFKDYGRWFANYYALAEFLGDSKGYDLYSEALYEEPDATCGENDLKQVNAAYAKDATKYIEQYACIRIFRDGTVMVMDSFGSTVHMVDGNLNLSAAKDINLEAGGALNINARDINLLAKDNIEITAITRGILCKAARWFEMCCVKGPMLLQSLMNKDEASGEIDDSEYTKRWENAEGNGLMLKTRTSDILVDTNKANNLIVQCGSYFNKSTKAFFRCTNFFIDKILNSVRGGIMNIVSPIVHMGWIYAGGISNKTAQKVIITGQDGLTQKHTGTNFDPVNEIEPEDEEILQEASVAEKATFTYRDPASDNLGSAIDVIYQTPTQQLVSLERTLQGSCFYDIQKHFKMELWGSYGTDYGSPEMGYPWYPGDPNSVDFSYYYPTISNTPINQPAQRTPDDLGPAKLNHSMRNGPGFTYYYYTDERDS